MVEGARLESGYIGQPVSRVQIPLSPPFLKDLKPEYSTSAFYFAIIDLAVLDGEVAVPCNLQSALARWNSRDRSSPVKLSLIGGDEILVLRNSTLRTVSDLDGSSTKESVLCAVRLPELSLLIKVTLGGDGSIKGVRLFINKIKVVNVPSFLVYSALYLLRVIVWLIWHFIVNGALECSKTS